MKKINCNFTFPFDDSFRNKILVLIRNGILANSSGTILKFEIKRLCQEYSFQLKDPDFPLSELFLTVTDMMLNGEISRLPDNACKVLIALLALEDSVVDDPKRTAAFLRKASGLNSNELEDALQHLESSSYIISTERPVLRKRSRRHGHSNTVFQAPSPTNDRSSTKGLRVNEGA